MDLKKLLEEKQWKQTPEFAAAAAAAVYGLLVHSFALNNILHNHDNIASQPGGYGTAMTLGRWFLEFLGRFFDKAGLNYNLPTVNGLVFIALLAVTAAFLISVLEIRSRGSALLVGALFVAFPTVTATMIYRYTVIFYGIGVLFAVLAVWVPGRFRGSLPVSAVLVALSLGIYQAYVPLTIALFVLQLILRGLRGEADARELVLQGLRDCLVLVVGLGLYFGAMKLSVVLLDIQLTEYQGISTLGGASLSQLPELAVNAVAAVLGLPARDYCGVANRALMRIAYLLLGLCTAVPVLHLLKKNVKTFAARTVILLLWAAFVLAVGFIEVMVPDGWIYTLMVYSFCLLACAPLAVVECLSGGDKKCIVDFCRKAVCFLVVLLVLFYGYYANVNYTAAYYAGEQIENYLSGIVTKATMTEGYTTDKQWALLGDIQDPLLDSPWSEEISYSGLGFTEYLLNQYSRNDWIKNYIGYRIPRADQQTRDALWVSEEVRAMPCYPNAGSIRVIGDTLVIKFQDP